MVSIYSHALLLQSMQACRRSLANTPLYAAREKVIGWYSTGPRLREADLDINELMSNYVDTPLLVICEVQVCGTIVVGDANAEQVDHQSNLGLHILCCFQQYLLACSPKRRAFPQRRTLQRTRSGR